MLVALGVWRYLIRGVPFAYDPLYWGGVFPRGMYSVCTYRLAEVLPAPFLMPISTLFMLVALAAWTAALLGLLDSLLASSRALDLAARSEEHTSEIQSLMRISYAVFCLKKKTTM